MKNQIVSTGATLNICHKNISRKECLNILQQNCLKIYIYILGCLENCICLVLLYSMELGLMLVKKHDQNRFLVLEDTAFNLAFNCQQALWAFLCHENSNIFFIISTRPRECVCNTQQCYWTGLVQGLCWLSTWFLISRLLKQLSSGVELHRKQGE